MKGEYILLKKQLESLAKKRKESEQAKTIFEKELRQFKKGEYFESAKKSLEKVEQRIKEIDKMIGKVKKEMTQVKEPKAKAKKRKK